MVKCLIFPHIMGILFGIFVGISIYILLFSKKYISFLYNWNNVIKIAPFLIISLMGGILGILKIIEFASETQPIYHMWAYIMGCQMIIISYGMITGFGCGGAIGYFINKFMDKLED